MDVRIGRIFNTFGPHMHPSDCRVVSNFIVQALRGEPITIYGRGRQTRSFCFVDDLVDGFVRYMNHDGPLPGPMNLGNPREVHEGWAGPDRPPHESGIEVRCGCSASATGRLDERGGRGAAALSSLRTAVPAA